MGLLGVSKGEGARTCSPGPLGYPPARQFPELVTLILGHPVEGALDDGGEVLGYLAAVSEGGLLLGDDVLDAAFVVPDCGLDLEALEAGVEVLEGGPLPGLGEVED